MYTFCWNKSEELSSYISLNSNEKHRNLGAIIPLDFEPSIKNSSHIFCNVAMDIKSFGFQLNLQQLFLNFHIFIYYFTSNFGIMLQISISLISSIFCAGICSFHRYFYFYIVELQELRNPFLQLQTLYNCPVSTLN